MASAAEVTGWPDIADDVSEEIIWDVKVMTATGRDELPYDKYMIVVYRRYEANATGLDPGALHTPNYCGTPGTIRSNIDQWPGARREAYRRAPGDPGKGRLSASNRSASERSERAVRGTP